MLLRSRCAALSMLALGCSGERPHAVHRALEVVVPTDTATLDPRFATRSLDIKITRLVHAGLFGLDPDSLEPRPLLVASYTRDEDTLQIQLKPGLRFHSGRPLTGADVCATLAAVADPQLYSPHRAVVRSLASCRSESPLRITLQLAEPRASWLADLELPILRADQAQSPPTPAGALDGLGPYRIRHATPTVVELEPASTGVAPAPRHAVVVRTVRDENARALRLLAGRSDVAPNAISAAVLPALARSELLEVRARTGANVTYLLMQNDRAPLSRVEVRRAIARAIDRRPIIEHLLAGRAQPAEALFPRGHWSLESPPGVPAYDPSAARAVLATIEPLTLLTSTDRVRVTIARALAQMLAEAGVPVRVVSLDLGVLLSRLDAGDFELASLQMPELTEPNLLKWFFHPSGVPGEGGEGKNRARYRNPRAAELLDRAAQVSDLEQRRQLYTELAALFARDLPVIPLWHEDQVAVVSQRARSFELSAEGRWSALAALP